MRASFAALRFAGEFQVMHRDLSERRGRALLPHRVDRIALDRHQLGARLGAGGLQPFHCRRSVQPGIEAQAVAGLQPLGQPCFRRRIDQRGHGPRGRVDLLGSLQRVAAVDEQHRAVGQDGGEAGRAGEAGQPGQPFVRRRHIFVLMAVGARNDEAGEIAARELLAQRRQAGSQRHAAFGVLECLEMRFEHRLTLTSRYPVPGRNLSIKFGTIHA